MPAASLRPCAARGCSGLVSRGVRYCQAHSKAPISQRRQVKPIQYGGRWRKVSKAFLGLPGNAWCRSCGAIAQCVDHVRAHEGDELLFWDQGNWQPLCNSCHSKKTASEDGGFGNEKRWKMEKNESTQKA